MRKTTIIRMALLGAGLLMTGGVYAQSTLNVSGHTARINGMTFDYSIGEMTLVSTEHAGNLIVTQGLLQPQGSGSGASDSPGNTTLGSLAGQVRVYPNPTDNVLFIETTEAPSEDLGYQVYDATGRVVLSSRPEERISTGKYRLDLHALAAGNYYLLIRQTDATGKPDQVSYKIQKVH